MAVRDHLGNWISGFSGACGTSTSIKAELFLMFHGLKKVWNDVYKLIICESNSKIALQLVRNNSDKFYPLFSFNKDDSESTSS
ncbi:hypothetical protein JHK87_028157 [Glycine soja]|nr:hypothetical protein JHK87_028157 [Glycine soja]